MRLRYIFTDRAINALLLLVLIILGGSGVLSLFANGTRTAVLFEAHRVAGAAFLLLLIPKGGIIWRSLRRRGRMARERASVTLALLLLLVTAGILAAVLGWSLARGPWAGEWGLPLIVVHWYLGLGAIPLVIGHVAIRWRRAGRQPTLRDFAGRRRLDRLRHRCGARARPVARPRARRAAHRGAGGGKALHRFARGGLWHAEWLLRDGVHQ